MNDARAPSIDDGRFDEAFDRSFAAAALVVNRFLVDHLLRAARELQVDQESLLLWGVLAQLNVAHLLPPGTGAVDTLSARGRLRTDARGMRPIRVSHLAQVSGLPRETIPRKLLRRQETGRVSQLALGWVVDVEAIDPDVRAFACETARRLRAAARQLDEVLAAGLAANDTGGGAGPVAKAGPEARLGPRKGAPATPRPVRRHDGGRMEARR